MGGTGSKLPEDQTIELEQDLHNGKNMAEINVDLRETQESNFLVMHQSTMVGMLVMLVIFGAIGITLYAFKVFWCRSIHDACGGKRHRRRDETEMAEKGGMPGRKDPAVTLIK